MTQAHALDILKMGENVFLTGPAGSGKTYVLNQYIQYLKEKGVGVAITASTGIAATHLGGMTIHAWSGLGIRSKLSPYDEDELETRKYLWDRYGKVHVLVIDEISMLHHFRFDLINRLCQMFKRSDSPFGGMQVVLCGDFFQLPPVSKEGEEQGLFAYASKSWKSMNLHVCYLKEQHRQEDETLLAILNTIRSNEVDEYTFELLQERFNKDPEINITPTKLYTHNVDVDKVNQEELNKLGGETFVYEMITRGARNIVETLKKSCLSPEKLVLKKGCKVMFVKNNYEIGYMNGTLGTVVRFEDGVPVVELKDGREVRVAQDAWQIEEDGKLRAELRQLPLRLAWAITVHKSQGMSLDAAEIDLSKAFTPGQGYVALSRVRSLEGLKLLGLNSNALSVHPEILEFDRELRKLSEESQDMLLSLSAKEKMRRNKAHLEKGGRSIKKLAVNEKGYKKTQELLKKHKCIKEIAEELSLTKGTVLGHIERLIEEGELVSLSHLKNSIKPDRLKKIREALLETFEEEDNYKLGKTRDKLGTTYDFEEIRLVRLLIISSEK